MQRNFKASLFVSIGMCLSAGAFAETAKKPTTLTPALETKLPDNSVQNQINNGASSSEVGGGISADQQTNSKNDLEILQKIRRSLTQEKKLSTYAQNIKVLSQNGQVILKGPVRTADEKLFIENKAAIVVGKEHVKSEIQVVPR